MAKVSIIVEMDNGERIEGIYRPFDIVINHLKAAASNNPTSREGYVGNLLCDALHAGMDNVLQANFKAWWEGFGPNKETIYERNVDAPDNSPYYAFYDTDTTRVHLTRTELLPLLNKLRA